MRSPFYTQRESGGGGSNPQSPQSGAIDGTNTVFTFKSPLNNLFVNEGFQTPGVDYTSTISGSTITVTFVVAPVPNSVIYAT